MSEKILIVRRLPGLPDRIQMQFETEEGEVLWTAPLDPRIGKILAGRWKCRLRGKIDQNNQMEILGEAL